MQMDMDDPWLTAWLAAVRAVHIGCCLLIGGTWAFDRMVAGATAGWRRAATGLLWAATPLALASGAAWLALVSAAMSGLPLAQAARPAVLRVVWAQTRFGRAWQVHAAFWAAGAIVAGARGATRRGGWAGLATSVGLVATLAWAGHGATGPIPGWHRAADVAHLLASAVWPAGLVPFALVLGHVSRSTDGDRWAVADRLARRFSIASLSAVGLLTLTGLVDSYCLLGSFGALVTTAYGRVLTAKLALFAVLLSLGAWNLLVLRPRLARGDGATAGRLWRTVALEIVLGTGVVAAVGLLGMLEPARP